MNIMYRPSVSGHPKGKHPSLIILSGLIISCLLLPLASMATASAIPTGTLPTPILDCPAAISVSCDSSTDPIATGEATANSACGEVDISFSDSFAAACGNTGTITRTWTGTDNCGGTTSCDQVITIASDVPPVLQIPSNETIGCSDSSAPTSTGLATATSGCGEVSVTFSDSSVSGCSTSETITRTWTATDECGQSTSDTQIITVVDNEGPVINYDVPSGSTVEVECNLADEDWTAFAEITEGIRVEDDCDLGQIDLEVDHQLVEEGICGVSDFLSIWQCTWTAMDECGNESTFELLVRIIDSEGPFWTDFPNDLEVACTEEIPEERPSAADNCSAVTDIDFVDEITDQSCPETYIIRRSWTARDGCGNATTDYQFITVVDEEAPTILFADEYISAYEDGDDVFIDCAEYGVITQLDYGVVAFDNCSEEVDIQFTFEDFGQFDCEADGYSGYIETHWTATDACGNSTTATLNWFLVDNTPPQLQGVPADACVTSLPPVPVVNGIDECDFVLVELTEVAPISCTDGQYVDRTWTATDACGNMATATQRIFLGDTEPPSITINYPNLTGLPSGSTGIVAADCEAGIEIVAPDLLAAISVVDGCTEVRVDQNLELLGEGGCVADGFLARYFLSVTASDLCGNTSTYELFIHLVDATPPTIEAPAELTLNCGEEIPIPTAFDECGEVIDQFFTGPEEIPASCAANPNFVDRFWLAMDACNNTGVFQQRIAVIDETGPIFENIPADACGITSDPVDIVAFDECTQMAMEVSLAETNHNLNGCGEVLLRTWTATDSCGNVSTATQRVILQDNMPPQLSFVHPLLIGLEDGDILEIPVGFAYGNPDSPLSFTSEAINIEDNCNGLLDISVQIESTSQEGCLGTGFLSQHHVEWMASDPCGNATTINIILAYIDNEAPEILDVPDYLRLYCVDEIPPVAEVRPRDNYDETLDTSFEEQVITTTYGFQLIRIWTATDDCGNHTEARQRIDIFENDLVSTFNHPTTVDCNTDNNMISVTVGGGTAPYTYQWEMIDCDGFITSDPTGETISYTLGYTTQNFSVTITDVNGCEHINNTSIECINNDFDAPPPGLPGGVFFSASIYPNPANHQLVIQSANLIEQPVEIYLYNLLGQRLYFQSIQQWPAEGWQLNTSSFPSGTYWVHLRTPEGPPTIEEVVIQH
ncbi:MAG: T9SS type A sorting domain-containing protein [Bacteroidota bacterium]